MPVNTHKGIKAAPRSAGLNAGRGAYLRANSGNAKRTSPLALSAMLCLALFLLAGLAGCQSGSESGVSSLAAPQKKSFSLEKGKKVLILPFECDIFSGSYAEASVPVQKTFAGWTLYALQAAGVHADVYMPERTAASAAAPETYLPLTPDSRLSRSTAGGLSAVPLHEGQWERSDFAGELTAGELSGREYADDHVVNSGTVLLSPPADSMDNGNGASGTGSTPVTLGADDSPLTPVAEERQAAQAESDREQALRLAAKKGYDYVLVGNVIFLHSEVKPIQNAGRRSATTVRGEFASAYRLLEPESGEIAASGAITGKAGKYVSLGSGVYNDSTINNAVSRVLNQTMASTAKNMTARLMNPGVRLYDGVLDNLDSDEEYYRDSPGKMRRN